MKPRLKTKEDYDNYYANGGFPYGKDSTRQFMIDIVKLPLLVKDYTEKPSLLDVGSGNGFLSEIFAEWFNVTGIEKSTVGIDIARRKVPSAKFIEGDVLKYTNKHDIVYVRACCVLACHTDTDQFRNNLKHLVSLAKKTFYFSEWTSSEVYNTDDGRWCYKNPEEVLIELKKYGNASMLYDNVTCNYVGRIDL